MVRRTVRTACLGVLLAAATVGPVTVPVPQPPSRSAISYGAWGAGYVADAPAGQRFTEILGEFLAPKYAPPPPPSGYSWMGAWAGIGLQATRGTQLMQDGLFEGMQAGDRGWALVVPWWINEPVAPTEPHVLSSLQVHAGDTILSVVKQTAPRVWTFTVKDVTTGQQAGGTCRDCAAGGHTAAWILEDPLSGTGQAQTNFADPSTVVFIKAEASMGKGLVALDKLRWHPVVRDAPNEIEKPTAAPGKNGAFTIGRVDAAPAGG